MTVRRIPFAITGMACHLPGANNLDEYWNLVRNGQSAIVRVPDERLHYDLYFEPRKEGGAYSKGKTYMDQAGLVQYPAFNNCLCPFPMDVVGHLESGHLLMCETVAAACRHAGLNPFNLPYRRTGVYVGNNQSGDLGSELAYSVLVEEAAEYLLDLPEFNHLTGTKAREIVKETVRNIRNGLPCYGERGLPSVAYHLTAAAVNSAFGLDGPAMVFDAACSSSLQALAIATRDLALGNTEMAIVGGASFFRVDSLMIFSAAKSGSAKGCCPFSDNADGLIPAEGYVAITVKTLERALADGDPIQAVIHGIGVSSDGKGKSLWAPSSDGQYEAIIRSYDNPEQMGQLAYLEAHATSTAVGDLTELNALTRAFDGKFKNGQKCPIGGVKANIGHALEAAGLAGLVKAVLVLQHNEAPAQINCSPFNTKVDWEKLPFFVPQKATPILPSVEGKPRMAGVNSFGIGGLNVHVALEESPKPSSRTSVSLVGIASHKKKSTQLASLPPVIARPATGLAEMAQEPIAVIGLGAILPGVRTEADFINVVFSGKNVFSKVTDNRWNTQLGLRPDNPDSYHAASGFGGFITDFEYDWRRHKIPPKQITNADPLQFMLMDATDSALADAGYDKKPLDRMRTGVLVGSSFDTDFSLALSMGFRHSHFQNKLKETLKRNGFANEDQNNVICEKYCQILFERMTAILDETGSFTPSSLSSRITKTYNLMGGAVTTEAGNVGALAVLAEAMNILRLHENDMMIVAAGSRMMGLPTFIRMGLAGTLSDKTDVRSVLDEAGGKTVPGEGAGVLLLKRLSDALADGDPIRCVLHGVGCAGVSPRANRERKTDAFRRAIDHAWRQTSASRTQVRLAELSGASAEISASELEALTKEYRSFDQSPQNQSPLVIGETHSQFGELFAASAAASLIKAQAELSQRKMPKLIGYSRPNSLVQTAIDGVHLPTSEEPLPASQNEDMFAAVSGWDSCGFIYHAVLEYRADGRYSVPEKMSEAVVDSSEPAPQKIDQTTISFEKSADFPWYLVRFGADSRNGLLNALRNNSSLNRPFGANDLERLVIVVPNTESLKSEMFQNQISSAIETLSVEESAAAKSPSEISEAAAKFESVFGISPQARTLLERNNIFYSRRLMNPGKIAFLFSGQGSQYPNMLDDLIQNFQPAQKAVAELNRILRQQGLPDFTELTITGAKELGVDVFRTQLSLLCADWILFQSLKAVGIQADIMAGHSFGEFPALLASGAWDLANSIRATKVRCDAIDECKDAFGGMLSTNANAQTVQKICEIFPGQAFPANINSPKQTVIGGRSEILPKVEEKLKEAGFASKIIPVPRPFHTPLMSSVRPILAQRLAKVPTSRPVTRFLSSVTNAPVDSVEEIICNLANQMTGPIDYIGLIRRIVNEGATLLVESGPKRVLTGLHDKILTESQTILTKPQVRCFDPDASGRKGGLGLYQLRALCETTGYLDKSGYLDNFSKIPATTSLSARDIKAELIKNRTRIRDLLAERAVQMSSQQTVAFRKMTFSPEIIEQINEVASILGILPESLGSWFGEQIQMNVARIPSNLDVGSLILQAVSDWQNPFDRMISRLEAENRSKRFVSQTNLETVDSEKANQVKTNLSSKTPKSSSPEQQTISTDSFETAEKWDISSSESVLITPTDFYNIVKRKKAPETVPNRKYRRFEISLMEKEFPKPDRNALNLSGRILIYGDNAAAHELSKKLSGSGQEIVILPCSGDISQDAAAAQKICEEAPTLHLFLMASHNESLFNKFSCENILGDQNNIDQNKEIGINKDDKLCRVNDCWEERRKIALGSYAVTQQWFLPILKAKKLASASVVASTLFGGGFGIVHPSEAVETGALAGLIKSLDLEAGFPTNFAFRAKIIDFEPTESAEFKADKILDVLAANVPYEVETGYIQGRRVLPRLVPAVANAPENNQGKNLLEQNNQTVPPAGLWVITGGGRGITAWLARGIARKYGLKLALIGSSPIPNIPDAWKNLDADKLKALRDQITQQANESGQNPQTLWNRTERAIALNQSLDQFAQDGINATYYACDVSQREMLRKTLDQIHQTEGPISGILHGAGLEVSTSFEKKDFATVQKTFAIKTEGAKNLIELTRNDPIRHFLGLGSIAGRMGSLGQSDYSMANDGLAKLLDRLQIERPDCRVSLFHWGPWDEIGMAVRPEMKSNPILQQMTFLPPAEGLDYVLEELAAKSEPVEKVFMAWDYFKLFYPVENNTPTAKELKADETRNAKRANQADNAGKTNQSASLNPINKTVSTTESASKVNSTKELLATSPTTTDSTNSYKMNRWEGRTVRIANISSESFKPLGNAIIYGNNEDATYLRAALERRGIKVLLLAENDNPQPLLKEIEDFWTQGIAPHLFIMSGRTNINRELSAQEWPRRRHEHYMTTSWIARLWLKLLTKENKLAGATVAAATAQGGGFGFSVEGQAPQTSNAAVDGTSIAGILKCIYMENGLPGGDGVLVRILDASDKTDPALVAESLLAELVNDDLGIERSIINGKRYAPRLLSVPIQTYPPKSGPSKGVWIITGGGRGISARAALALGKQFGVSIHLLGTSPVPNLPDAVLKYNEAEMANYKKQVIRDAMKKKISPEKAWGPIRKAIEIEQNLRVMKEAGIHAVYHQCNVLDVHGMETVLNEIRKTDGPIEGVLHGAGIDGIPATVRDIIDSQFADDEILTAIKTDAVLNLWELLRNDPLKYFIGFGSISGRFGSASASSYCAANDTLCKMMAQFRRERPNVHSFAFHWHAWDEIGMMMRPVSYGSIKILKMELMSPAEGTGRLIDEIQAEGPSSEIIVTDRHYFSTFYAPEMEIRQENEFSSVKTNSLGNVSANAAPMKSSEAVAFSPSEKQNNQSFPLIEKVLERTNNQLLAEAQFQPASDPFLLDHQLRNKPLLPAVISAEAFCETVRSAVTDEHNVEQEKIVAIENLTFKDGLVFNDPEPKTVKIQTEQTEPHRWNCRLCADFYNTKGKLVLADRVHSEGTVVTASGTVQPLSPNRNDDLSWMTPPDFKTVQWSPIEYLPQGAAMFHGPVFQQLKHCAFFEQDSHLISWGELTVLPQAEFSRGRKGIWSLSPSTVDACLYQCGVSVWYRTNGKIGLPKTLGQLRLGRLPHDGEQCRVVCRSVSFTEQGKTGEEVFQFALFGADGQLILWGDHYVCQILMQ